MKQIADTFKRFIPEDLHVDFEEFTKQAEKGLLYDDIEKDGEGNPLCDCRANTIQAENNLNVLEKEIDNAKFNVDQVSNIIDKLFDSVELIADYGRLAGIPSIEKMASDVDDLISEASSEVDNCLSIFDDDIRDAVSELSDSIDYMEVSK